MPGSGSESGPLAAFGRIPVEVEGSRNDDGLDAAREQFLGGTASRFAWRSGIASSPLGWKRSIEASTRQCAPLMPGKARIWLRPLGRMRSHRPSL
jgi:hypothetical protein